MVSLLPPEYWIKKSQMQDIERTNEHWPRLSSFLHLYIQQLSGMSSVQRCDVNIATKFIALSVRFYFINAKGIQIYFFSLQIFFIMVQLFKLCFRIIQMKICHSIKFGDSHQPYWNTSIVIVGGQITMVTTQLNLPNPCHGNQCGLSTPATYHF